MTNQIKITIPPHSKHVKSAIKRNVKTQLFKQPLRNRGLKTPTTPTQNNKGEDMAQKNASLRQHYFY